MGLPAIPRFSLPSLPFRDLCGQGISFLSLALPRRVARGLDDLCGALGSRQLTAGIWIAWATSFAPVLPDEQGGGVFGSSPRGGLSVRLVEEAVHLDAMFSKLAASVIVSVSSNARCSVPSLATNASRDPDRSFSTRSASAVQSPLALVPGSDDRCIDRCRRSPCSLSVSARALSLPVELRLRIAP